MIRLLRLSGANQTLDDIYISTQKWAYDRFSTDEGAVYTATALTSSNQHANANIVNGTGTFSSGNMGLYDTDDLPNTDVQTVAANTAWSTINFMRTNGVNFLEQANGQTHSWLRGFIYMFRDASNWALFSFNRTYQQTGGSNNYQQSALTHIASAGNVGTNATVRMQISELRDSLAFVTTWPNREFLWRTDVGLRPSEASGSRYMARRTTFDFADSDITAGAVLNTVNLDANSSITNCEHLQVNVEGSGSVTGFRTSTNGNAIADGVTVSSGVTLNFAGGSTYLVAGDISNATLVRTGSGTVNIIFVGNGVGPASATNFTFTKRVTVTFTGTANWVSSEADTETVANIGAVHRASSASTGGTAITATPTFSNADVSYNFEIPVANDLHYTFAARQNAGGEFYDVVQGSSATTLTPSHTLVATATNIVPVTVAQGLTNITGWTDHLNYIRDNTVVEALTAAPSGTDPMTITISDSAIAGLLAHGQHITRLVQQKTNWLLNVSRGWYPVNGWAIGTDRVIYNNVNVQWTKSAANVNLVSFGIQTLTSLGAGANFAITTTANNTAVLWNGPQNIGILNEAQAARLQLLALESSVWAANAAL